MGVEFVLVQHGEKARTAGDPGLTPAGVQQAARTAAFLARRHRAGERIDGLRASPARRTRETAAPLAAALGLPVRLDARLRERMNWGDGPAGQALDDFLREWPPAAAVGDDDRQLAMPAGQLSAGRLPVRAGVVDGPLRGTPSAVTMAAKSQAETPRRAVSIVHPDTQHQVPAPVRAQASCHDLDEPVVPAQAGTPLGVRNATASWCRRSRFSARSAGRPRSAVSAMPTRIATQSNTV